MGKRSSTGLWGKGKGAAQGDGGREKGAKRRTTSNMCVRNISSIPIIGTLVPFDFFFKTGGGMKRMFRAFCRCVEEITTQEHWTDLVPGSARTRIHDRNKLLGRARRITALQ